MASQLNRRVDKLLKGEDRKSMNYFNRIKVSVH